MAVLVIRRYSEYDVERTYVDSFSRFFAYGRT
jgi:hypothetical protein